MTDWIIFTPAKRTSAKALNNTDTTLEPRLIDNPKHPNFGSTCLQASILTAKGYERFNAGIKTLSKIEAEPEELFLPDEA